MQLFSTINPNVQSGYLDNFKNGHCEGSECVSRLQAQVLHTVKSIMANIMLKV